eukprot:CAMPEP_0170515048 /NCGR_PEP_ID=MMETSP0209-20121228/1539_1 /TAXON_ID=665100 ORGANISM="Litonotus pictus, Strain P1" /NCGR_SAMPLE_ID=MMETSP0209 /ASSEMBLY_ACC=CAM_ASM_000301 /LENGTH=225 /DNA_ID=CAMNT_0010799365 /DNA_START=1 /DNA_END=678 /DNA_ORIENTATION=-
MKFWLFLFGSSVISYNFISVYLSYLLLAYLIYTILTDLHIVGETKFNSGTIKGSTIYYKKVKGPYKEVSPHFEESVKVLTKFNLYGKYEYNTFGFYFDDPKEVKEEDCRAIIGIIFTPSETGMKINDDLETYLKGENYLTSEIPPTAALVARFHLVIQISFLFAIRRFYKDLERSLCDKEFVSKMRIKPEKIPGVMELYKPNMLEFYVPTGNQDKYKLWDEPTSQ